MNEYLDFADQINEKLSIFRSKYEMLKEQAISEFKDQQASER